MTLVDTSVWVAHFRNGSSPLAKLVRLPFATHP
jgi:predicted nucleic acid-binding protein